MKKTLFAAVIALSLSLTGCSAEPEFSESEIQALLVDPSSIAVDAIEGNEADFVDYVFADSWSEYPECSRSAEIFDSVKALPLVGQRDVGIESNMTLSFHQWILDAGSSQKATDLVQQLSDEFLPEECASIGLDSSVGATLQEVLGGDYPGHLWVRTGGFDPTTVNDLAVTNRDRYIMFVYATGRSSEFGESTFNQTDAGSAVGEALNVFTGF
jgi:hypothetical protein